MSKNTLIIAGVVGAALVGSLVFKSFTKTEETFVKGFEQGLKVLETKPENVNTLPIQGQKKIFDTSENIDILNKASFRAAENIDPDTGIPKIGAFIGGVPQIVFGAVGDSFSWLTKKLNGEL